MAPSFNPYFWMGTKLILQPLFNITEEYSLDNSNNMEEKIKLFFIPYLT